MRQRVLNIALFHFLPENFILTNTHSNTYFTYTQGATRHRSFPHSSIFHCPLISTKTGTG